MILEETFTVDSSREKVWNFLLNNQERVANCVPGVADFKELEPDRYHFTLSQKVGHLGATFDLKAAIIDKQADDRLVFTVTGRSVRGVRGDLSSKNQVELSDAADGATTVSVRCDVTLGGMVGSIGHRPVAAKVKEVVSVFSSNLSGELRKLASE